MPQSIRSILGKSNRVRKPASPVKRGSGVSSPSPRKQATPGRGKGSKAARGDDEDLFQDRLDDGGFARLLAEELTLRDVVQAIRYIRSRMFSPVPEKGLSSTRIAELHAFRATMPPIVTMGHLNAVLSSNPTAVERETAELQHKGVLRKVRIERRGGHGEGLIEAADLGRLLADAHGVSPETRRALAVFLDAQPTAQQLPRDVLTGAQVDELIRAGFLTSFAHADPGSLLHVRPEERTTLVSIDRVARHASGSVWAVGGHNAIHLSGGGSGALALPSSSLSKSPSSSSYSSSSLLHELRLAIPGHGRHLKLATACVEWVRESLGRTRWGECPESWLRERFEGGGLYGPRWKQFWGVEWDWALGEAVGLGAVEVFMTGSVGRGVRALG